MEQNNDNTDTTTSTPESSGDDRRDDISRAFDQVETRDAPPGETPGALPATSKAAPPSDLAAPPAPAPGERVRGPDGRFAPTGAPGEPPAKAPEKAAAAPGAPKLPEAPKAPPAPGQRPPDAPAPQAAAQSRAPASWKPGAREHWGKLPPEVQQEVVRRETEVARSLQESHSARTALQHVQQVMGPFSQNIAASGGDAISMINTLMTVDNRLRHGSSGDKAAMVADIIKTYGVNIEALDSVLAGQAPKTKPNEQLAEQLRMEMQQQLAPVMQHFSQLRGQRERQLQQINQDASTDVQAFSESNEFFDDVRQDMADIIDLYTARGQSISLQDAYTRAINLNPQVSEIVAKRAEQERVSAAAKAAQRARRTATSLSSGNAPAGAVPGASGGDDRRAVIEAAFDHHSQG